MMRDHDRIIDPRDIGRGIRERRLGAIPERALQREQETQSKFDRANPMILTATIGPFFREDVVAAVPNPMRMLSLATSSTNPAVANALYNSGTGMTFTLKQACRVVGGFLRTDNSITAGSITLAARINAVDYPLTDATLDSTTTADPLAWIGWKNGYPVAAGGNVAPSVIASSGLTPATVDVAAWLIIGWEEPT